MLILRKLLLLRQGPDGASSILVRNTFFNLMTQGILIGVAMWSMPRLARGLTHGGFGLLVLIWAVIGYFSLLDFGISRAVTKFLSEALIINDERKIRNVVWASISVASLLGICFLIIVVCCSPFLVHNVFQIQPALLDEASNALILSAIGIPFMLIFGVIKGLQMAMQRFDIVNIYQAVLGTVQWLGSVILLFLGWGLHEIILLTVGTRIALTVFAFFLLPNFIPRLFENIIFWDRETIRRLFTFGGWVTVSQVIGPVYLYLDRILVGVFLSMTDVAYYSVPQETLTRLLVFPMSLTATLFPALSERSLSPNKSSGASALHLRAIKYVTFGMLPVIIVFVLYASPVLNLWMGKDFAEHGGFVFQILSIGLLFCAVAQIPLTSLHAFGRPDLPAKFHLIELPIMIGLGLILIPSVGISGAAIAWSIRVLIDAWLLFFAARRYLGVYLYNDNEKVLEHKIFYIAFLFLVPAFLLIMIYDSTMKLTATVGLLITYFFVIWNYAFDIIDREMFLQFRKKLFS